ncbi:hypothetical protein O181_095374 [Austropuccinia psidii MF-1]|uniref:Chromo domain-containing protein n=1 Tax=Austropuccinia psidii MF-1 TaxID=1389203 RepID=A0A9Q3J4Z8_9BASI|nr:hypothetical protein [Austropuccinia psidii MF-1]
MESKDHEGYTHYWVALLTEVHLAYNTSQHSNTGKSPSLAEKGFNPLLPVDHLKKNLLTIHPTAKDFHDMKICNGIQTHRGIFQETPKFPGILVKPYFQTEEDKFPFRKKNTTPPGIVEVEDSPGPVKKIIKARKIILNGKDTRKYVVRFKNQTADKDQWLAEHAIPDGNLHLRG